MNKILIDERRHSLLTETDKATIREVVKTLLEEHHCKFNSEELVIVRDFIKIYKDTRSIVLRFVIGCVLLTVFALFVLGVKNNIVKVKTPVIEIGE